MRVFGGFLGKLWQGKPGRAIDNSRRRFIGALAVLAVPGVARAEPKERSILTGCPFKLEQFWVKGSGDGPYVELTTGTRGDRLKAWQAAAGAGIAYASYERHYHFNFRQGTMAPRADDDDGVSYTVAIGREAEVYGQAFAVGAGKDEPWPWRNDPFFRLFYGPECNPGVRPARTVAADNRIKYNNLIHSTQYDTDDARNNDHRFVDSSTAKVRAYVRFNVSLMLTYKWVKEDGDRKIVPEKILVDRNISFAFIADGESQPFYVETPDMVRAATFYDPAWFPEPGHEAEERRKSRGATSSWVFYTDERALQQMTVAEGGSQLCRVGLYTSSPYEFLLDEATARKLLVSRFRIVVYFEDQPILTQYYDSRHNGAWQSFVAACDKRYRSYTDIDDFEKIEGYCGYASPSTLETPQLNNQFLAAGEKPEATGGGGCFLTTATVQCLGLSDDCFELSSLRALRDRYLLATPQGRRRVAAYYRLAPAIVRRVEARPDARRIWLGLYWRHILPAAVAAKVGANRLAMRIYLGMIRRVQAL